MAPVIRKAILPITMLPNASSMMTCWRITPTACTPIGIANPTSPRKAILISIAVRWKTAYHHFALCIEKQLLPISPAFTAEVAKHHASHTHLANLFSLLPKDSILPAPAGELENLKQKLAKAPDRSEP